MGLNGHPLEDAILRTIIYADIFSFPMTVREIHHFLIHDVSVHFEQVQEKLAESPRLQKELIQQSGYFALAERREIITLRLQREAYSENLWTHGVYYGKWLARLPFVRMVALTGALAMRNALTDDDDLDYLIIAQPGRVWLARVFTIALVKLAAKRGVVICPNYVLAADNLEQNRKDLYIAHEIVQMVPLYGSHIYRLILQANEWVAQYMPNAHHPFYAEHEYKQHKFWAFIKNIAERLLTGPHGDWIEQWERRRKLHRFASNMQTPHSSAQLDETQVKGHFDDHGHPVLSKYYQRLHEYGLDYVREAATGN
ncbi:MAG: hypothetical protein D6737_17630 [Chloroflexi bacterium]|nr:MAG: hypothetical protein CUN54_06075 [Phototrophicales bacterium]RMF77465.1 MAG: hypothetical protein D6737_17630 [Chloroflexota bacterium]